MSGRIPTASTAPRIIRLYAGYFAVGIDCHPRPQRRIYRPQPPYSDRGSSVWNRRFSGSFLHFNVGAVDAVGVLRTSPPTSCSPELTTDEAGTSVIPMPAPYFPAETWSRSAE